MSTQSWDPETYTRNARFVSDLGEDLLDLLAARRGECVLDLGCGDGALTEKIAAAGCQVVAVDGSAAQVAAARSRGLDARVCDATRLPFEAEFDAVFSNAVLHWIADITGVLGGVHRALRPGGRFVAEMGGAGNLMALRSALGAALGKRGIDARTLEPWVFPSVEEYRRHLEACGFRVERIILFSRPTPLPGDLGGWLETFGQSFLNAVDEADRRTLIEDVSDAARADLYRNGTWVADYVRLRFVAERSGAGRQ